MARKSSVTLTPGLKVVSDALNQVMDEMSPKLHDALQAAYRGEADRRFTQLINSACEEYRKPKGEYKELGSYRHWSSSYSSYASGPTEKEQEAYRKAGRGYWPHYTTWQQICEFPDLFHVTYLTADRKAKMSLENARASFVDKNVGKFQSVLGDRNDVENVDIKVTWSHGIFEGSIKVKLSDAEILASVGLKYVFRTIPNITPYYQYPLIFRQVTVKGQKKPAPSEEEVRVLLGAPPPPTEEEARVAKGLCEMSGKQLPIEKWRPISMMMSPYTRCPKCDQGVSAQRGVYRAHKTVAAVREELLAKGYCEMSDQPIPPDVVRTVVAAAIKKDPAYARVILEKPFDTYGVRFPCTVCKSKGEATRHGMYKQHKTKV